MAESRRSAQPYSRCVFVNCPFDKTFKPILDAILFAIHDCGFIARIALEDAGTGDARLQRIRKIIEESRFSIHNIPGAAYIQKRFKLFKAQLPAMAEVAKLSLRELQGLDYLPELLHLMIAWQKKVDRLTKKAQRRPPRGAR
jgi:hypothetical protein